MKRRPGLVSFCKKMTDLDMVSAVFMAHAGIYASLYEHVSWKKIEAIVNSLYIVSLSCFVQSELFYSIFLGHAIFSLIVPWSNLEVYNKSCFYPIFYNLNNIIVLWFTDSYSLLIFELPVVAKSVVNLVNPKEGQCFLCWIDILFRVLVPLLFSYQGVFGKLPSTCMLIFTYISWF